jgi:hypothetical protein
MRSDEDNSRAAEGAQAPNFANTDGTDPAMAAPVTLNALSLNSWSMMEGVTAIVFSRYNRCVSLCPLDIPLAGAGRAERTAAIKPEPIITEKY